MKIAPIWRALRKRGAVVRLLQTGQHEGGAMSDVFFRDLDLPPPDARLHIGGGSHAEQTAAALVGVEADLLAHRPDLVVVVGDVTSTLAAALAAAKLPPPVAHLQPRVPPTDSTL